MTFSFQCVGSVRSSVLGSLCLLLAAGCSGDASLGGDQKEQGVGKDSSDGAGGTSSNTDDKPASTTGTDPTTSTTGAVGGSGGTDAQVTTGSDPTGGVATNGSDPTGGTATSGSDPTTGTTTGTGGFNCEEVQCVRAIECVESCDGPVLKTGCCPCDEGTFDNIECTAATGGSGGTGGGDSCTSSDDCADDEYCALAEGICGGDDAVGTCAWRPELCTLEHAPVCGCDGQIYSNDCMAASEGVNLTASEACAE